jgi:hypothetical protein
LGLVVARRRQFRPKAGIADDCVEKDLLAVGVALEDVGQAVDAYRLAPVSWPTSITPP